MSGRFASVIVVIALATGSLACAGTRFDWRKGTWTEVVEVAEEERYKPELDTKREARLKSVPNLPGDELVQVFHRKSGAWDRLSEDGRWTHGKPNGSEGPVQVRPTGAPPRAKMTEEGIFRLEEAIATANLPSLPKEIPAVDPSRPNLEPLCFTVHEGQGDVTVEILADRNDPRTLGPLESLYRVMLETAFGEPE